MKRYIYQKERHSFGVGFRGLLIGIYTFSAVLSAQVGPVLTRSNGNLRQGVYQDAYLTPQNISKLHKLYTIQIPGDKRGIESQPLVLPNVKGSDGTTRDLIVLSTLANDVIACDLKDGKQIWRTNLGRPIDSTKQIDFWNLADHQGILSTGVIDPDTKIFYVVTWSANSGLAKDGHHALHAIDLTTGKEVKKPLSMNPLTYDPGNGLPIQKFAGQMRKQRSALLLQTIGGRKTIFLAAGSVLETNGAASGWVAATDIAAWRFTGSWSSTSKYSGAGIWMAGQGLSADSEGNLYALTGNGSFSPPTDFGESFIKLKYTPPTDPAKGMGKIECIDWWSPYSDAGRVGQDPTLPYPNTIPAKISGINTPTSTGVLIQPVEQVNADSSHHAQMMAPKDDPRYKAWGDQDLGSGGIAVIPEYNLIIGAGKDGIGYSVRMDNMGKTQLADFSSPAKNYAKLLSPPVWLTYAAFKHINGQVVGFESAAPDDVTKLDFNYDSQTHHLHGSPIVFDSANLGKLLILGGENGNLRVNKINPDGSLKFLGNGQELASPLAPKNRGGMPGFQIAVSANHGTNGIAWALVPDGDANREITTGKILAYGLSDIGRYPDGSGWVKTIFNAPLTAHPKFNIPIISNGRVIIPTYNATVDVYGLN